MAGLGIGAPIVKVYHEKSIILPDVSRVLACLYEKEIDFERETFSSYKSLLRLQASSHVPVPFYDGPNKFLEESRDICRHIAETYEDHGYPFLLGKDSLERASIEEWLHHEEHNFNPPSRSLFCHLAFPVAEEDDDIDLQTRKLEDVLEVYEQRLGDSEFLAGNKFTLADLVHLPNSYHITNSEKFLYLYDSRKNVQRWWHAISSRGSWQKVLKVMHEVERQNKQEELDKQQQRKQEELEKQQRRQWRRQHPPTSRSPFRLDSREQPSTKPHTILVRPPASIIAPKAPQAEEPHPTETSRDETPVSSSPSIPTTHKPSDVRSKHTTISTTHEETPPASVQSTPRIAKKSPIPVERRINFFTPATSPTTTEKPSRTGVDKPRIGDASLTSEATEIDLPTKSKPSSSKKAPNNLHVFDFYEASRHTDEAEPYTGPTSSKPSEMLDEISETDGPSNAIDHAETSPRSAKEDSDRLRASGFWTENTAPNADTEDKKSVRYTERTSQRPVGNISSRATDQRVTYTSPEKPHSTEAHQKLQSEQWHAAAAGFPADRRKDASLPKGAGDDTQAIPLYDDDDTNQEARETASAPRRTRAQDPYDTPEGTSSRSQPISAPHDAVPPPKRATSEGPYARKDVVEARRFRVDRRKDAPLPKRVQDDTQAIPLYDDDDDDTSQEAREPVSAPRRARAQDPYYTSERTSSRSQPVNAPHDAVPPPKRATSEGPYARKDVVEARRFPADRRKDAPLPKHVQDGTQAIPLYDDDTSQEARETASAPRRARAQDPYDTSEGTSSRSQPVNAPHDAVPPPKRATSEGPARKDAVEARRFPVDHRKNAPLPKRVRDDTQAIPLYGDDHDTNQEARETASAPRRTRAQDPYDTSEGIGTYHSSSSRPHPVNAPHDAVPPPKQAASEGSRRATAPYLAAQEVFQQGRKSPASRPIVPHDAQGSTEEEETVESSSKAHPLDSHLADVRPPNQFLDEDGYGASTPLQTGDTDDPYNGKRDRGAAAPKRMMSQDAFEETKMTDSASFEAQTSDHRQADAPPQKQRPTEDPLTTASPSKKRYSDDEDSAKQAKHAHQKLQSEQWHAATTGLSNLKGETDDFMPPTQQEKPSKDVQHISSQDTEQANTRPLAQEPVGMDGQLVQGPERTAQTSPTRYPRVEETSKQPRAPASIPTHIAAQGARDVFRESKVADSTPLQKRYPDAKDVAKKSKVTFEETKNSDSAPSRGQPLDSQGADAPSWKKEAADAPSRGQPLYSQRADAPSRKKEATEDPRSTAPVKKRHSDVEDTTKQSRDNGFKPRQIVGQDAQGTYKETKPSDPVSYREQSSDTWQAAPTPREKIATEGGPSVTPPSKRRSPSDEDTIKQPRGTAPAPRRTTSHDANVRFQDSKPADSMSSREQPLRSRKEVEDSRSKTSAFDKTHPYVEDSTRQAADTDFGPRQIGDEDITEEKKVADSAPSVRARHTDTPRTARPLSQLAEEEEDAQDKYREGRETARPLSQQAEEEEDVQDKDREGRDTVSAPKKMVSRDAHDTYGERRTPHSTSTSPTPSKAQPADSRSPIKVERPRSIYEEDHLVGQDSHKQPQTLPTGGRADGSTLKHQQDPVVPSISEEKSSTPPAPPRARVRDDHPTEEPFKGDIVDDRKGSPPLLGQEPTSQVQRATELSQKAAPDGELSTIDQWRRTSVPLQGDDVLGGSTIDQKPTPMSEKSIPSARRANEMVKKEQRMVPPARTGAQTPDVQRAPSSFSRADTAERDGEPVQMQAPTQHARPTSVPTRRATPDARDTSDQEFANKSDAQRWNALKAKHDVAMTSEDVRDDSLSTHDATVDNKTALPASEAQGSGPWPGSTATPVNAQPTSDDARVRRFPRDKGAQPPESTQAQPPFDAPHDSVSTQDVPRDTLGKTKSAKPSSTEGMTPTAGPAPTLKAQLAEHKFAPSDQKLARAAQPTSTEGMPPTAGPQPTFKAQLAEQKFAPSDKKVARAAPESSKEGTGFSAPEKPQTIFRQEARPSAPITKQVPSSDAHHDTRKIKHVTLANFPPDVSPIPPFPSREQVPHAPQTFPNKKDMAPAPGTKDSLAPDTQIASENVQEAIPDNYRTDELTVPFVSSGKQGSYAGPFTEPQEGPSPDAHGAADDKDITKYPSDSYVRPTSGSDVFPAVKKSAPSDQDSVQSAKQPSPAETKKEETIVAAAEPTLPTIVGKDTEGMRGTPTLDYDPTGDKRADIQSGRSDEVALPEQKSGPSDRDSARSTQSRSSAEPMDKELNYPSSAKPLSSATPDQTKDLQPTIGQQVPAPGTSEYPSSGTHHTSGKFQEVAPDDHHIVESSPGKGQVYRTEPDLEVSEGLVPYSRSVIGEKTMRPPSSQAQSSDSKPDPTQNRGDEPSTRSLPNQVAKQHAETQSPPTLVVPYDSESTQDVTSDTLGKAKSLKPSSIDQQATGSASTPDTHLGGASGEVARPGQKLPLKDQDSANSTQKSSYSEPQKEQSTVAAPNQSKGSQATSEVVTPADQSIAPSEPLSFVETNKEFTVAEAEESKVSRPVNAQQDIKHVPDISEPVLDNVSMEEQYQHASEPREGPPPDVHGTFVDRKTAPSSSQAQRPDAKHDVLPLSVDVDKKTVPPSSQAQILPSSVDVGPSSNEQPTTRLRRDQEAQAQLPAATKQPPPFEAPVYSKSNQDAPKSFKLPSADQDVMSPKVVPASAPDTQFGLVSDEITHDGQNSPLSAQDIARSAQRPFFVEPTKEDGIVAASGQTNEARPISGQRGITPTPDKQRIPDLRGAGDEKMSLPSSQAQNSDIRPDSAPIGGDVHRTSGDEPATSSVRDSQARPPAGTQNVPDGFLENTKSPRPPSTDQEPMASLAPAPDAPQDQDSNRSSQFSPSLVSRKDVANADQTNVSQAGLREPPSSDAKLPSKEIQESSPDAYLTKSEKPLPMKDPVRPPHEASFDLSSGEKPPMIKGDQVSTISDVSPSASEEVGQSKNSAVKGPISAELVSSFPQKNLEKTSPEEKWNQQQQTDQSTTRSSEDNNIEASGTRNPNTSTTSRDIQPSPLKERMQAVEGSRNQQQSDQAVFQSIQDNRTQIQETKARDTGFDKPEVIRADSAPTSGDAHRTSGDGPTTSSLRDSQAQPSAGTENVPAVYSEKESPRPLSTDQEVMKPMTNPTPAPDSPQDQYSNHASQFTPSVVSRKNVANADKTNISEAGLRGPASSDATLSSEQIQESRPDDYLTKSEKELPMKGTDPVQPPEVAAFDLPSDGKPTMIKGDQVNTISSVSLSASQPVGESESAVERPLSDELVSSFPEKHLEKRSPEEKSNQQQQTDQSSTRLTKDDSIESSGIASQNILTTSRDIQPSPLKQNNQAAERSRKQQQADPVFQSTQDNKRQTEETEAQDTGSDQHEEINPDSAPTSGDANRTSGDGPATSSLRNSQAQPPAETQNAPVVFSEKIKSPRPPSTDQELVTPLTSPAPTPDTPQEKDSTRSPQLPPPVESRRDIANTGQTNLSPAGLRETASSDAMPPSEKIQESSPDAYLSKSEKPILPLTGTDTVQPPVEGSFDLSSDGKPTMIKGDQANTKSNVSLSPSQAVGQSENSAVKGAPSDDSVSPFPQKNLERTSPEEKPKQQQQSSTRSSRDDSIEASETASPNILASGDIQPSPLNQRSPMKENIQAAEGFRNQQQADQDFFQPRQDNRKQMEETEAQDTSTDYPENTNGASQRAALEQQQGENVRRAQRQSNDTNNSYEPTKDAPNIIQADNKPESSSRTPEEPRQQAQPEGKTRGGEIMSPASETGQPEESDLPPSNKGITSQSQSETSDKLEDQTSSSTRNRGTDSSKLDGATDDTKSADTDDNNPSS
ncbi:microtubule-associated protein futsch isoform X4 [Triticum aestivum]|uniref:microtubule-associated protein futsch isoform X4 n=1 Tax=Triticum aestivum TaxID=4565 RepID=UPI001D005C7B|nr:microtubule-associated protein futsch-like isoform X4 [Triticum aestivum]